MGQFLEPIIDFPCDSNKREKRILQRRGPSRRLILWRGEMEEGNPSPEAPSLTGLG